MTETQHKIEEQLLADIESADAEHKTREIENYRHFMEACDISIKIEKHKKD